MTKYFPLDSSYSNRNVNGEFTATTVFFTNYVFAVFSINTYVYMLHSAFLFQTYHKVCFFNTYIQGPPPYSLQSHTLCDAVTRYGTPTHTQLGVFFGGECKKP